jgi:glucose/arabinose dehydrogenase
MVLVGTVLGGCGEDGPVELPPLELAPALGGERYAEPVEIGTYPDGRLFLAERAGRVLLVSEEDPAGAVLLEITDRVDDDYGEGLLSVALDPGFESNGFVWVYYFAEGDPDQTLLSRFSVAGDVADPASELVALALEQPGFNQNGGAIRFGPDDGMLYLSLGDGSASTDPFMNGQNLGTLLGTVIRIDVREASEAEPYRVPSDNPFVETAGARAEIWAYGLRNPWRMTIDAESGEMWLGDVQVSTEEEVDRVERGDNLGWSVMEGAGCLSRTGCDPDGYVLPRATYPHGEGRCAVIGGVVYRGEAIEALAGRYLYGDFCSGRMWALDREGGSAPELIADLEGQLTSFGTDADEEVLVLDIDGGGVYRLREAE